MRLVRSALIVGLGLSGLVSLAQSPARATESSRVTSRCGGPGPFALHINTDLLRDDLRVETVEPPSSRPPHRTPAQTKQAQRGVCQDPKTGRTVFENDVRLASLKRLPLADASTGGDEGREAALEGLDANASAPAAKGVSPNDEQFLPRVIIGSDNRIVQSPATAFPFRAVVKVIMTYQFDPNTPKKAFGCTGSMIGGFHVLTAGHCVFKQPDAKFPNVFGWADSVLVIPGFDGGSSPSKPFGQTFVSKPLRSFKSWTNDGDIEGDIGLITLDQTFTVGSFGLLYLSDGTLDNTNAQLIGYPGERGSPAGTQQFFVPGGGPITDYDSGIVFHTIDTTPGQSGSGVYRFWNDKRSIFGVHHGGCNSVNCGARITKSRHDTIRGWQCKDGQSISGVC